MYNNNVHVEVMIIKVFEVRQSNLKLIEGIHEPVGLLTFSEFHSFYIKQQ